MRSKILTFLVAILFLSSVGGTNVYASSTYVDENSDIEEVERVIAEYIITTDDGQVIFDSERAEEDGQSEFLIESGELINQLNQEYNPSAISPRISLPVWGNWCGPGYGGGPTKDLLDAACKQHDLDYGKYGYFDCNSDKRLIARIVVNYPSMGFLEKQMGAAVVGYFQAQAAVNGCF